MRSQGRHAFFVLGLVFLFIGLIWMQAIYQRCEAIYPSSLRATAQSEHGQAGQAAQGKERARMMRSPAAKGYHFILFWTLTSWEAACALLYIVSGLMILRRSFFASGLALVAVSMDAGFKLAAILYMQFCAIPLAITTGNANLMESYFFATRDGWARFSGLMTGLAIYHLKTWGDAAVAILFLLFSYQILHKHQARRAS
jgi:hypothetical protein